MLQYCTKTKFSLSGNKLILEQNMSDSDGGNNFIFLLISCAHILQFLQDLLKQNKENLINQETL